MKIKITETESKTVEVRDYEQALRLFGDGIITLKYEGCEFEVLPDDCPADEDYTDYKEQ